VSANLNTPAAIPSKAIRAARGRFMAEAQAGAVGAWDWNPTAAGTTSDAGVLINIYNDGSDPIKRYEAVTLGGTTFGVELDACITALEANNCGHGKYCNLGTCNSWPGPYSQVPTSAATYGVTFNASNANTAPTPGNLQQWAVCTNDLPAGEHGTAYIGGTFYAMIWDPDGLLGASGELQFVDLPQDLTGYTSATDSSPEILLPLRVRGNGRGRILWYDDTTTIWDDDPASGTNTLPWAMTKVRLALIERSASFVYPSIPVEITGEATTGTNQWTYNWQAKHNASCTSTLIAPAINLAEVNNTAVLINGVASSDLDDCFGSGGWELQSTYAADQEVMLTIAMDAAGAVQPYFSLQNQIVPT
jgi:hypothetical protein